MSKQQENESFNLLSDSDLLSNGKSTSNKINSKISESRILRIQLGSGMILTFKKERNNSKILNQWAEQILENFSEN